MSKKTAILGTLFSDSSSDESSDIIGGRQYRTSVSDNGSRPIHRSAMTSADEKKRNRPRDRLTERQPLPNIQAIASNVDVPDGYVLYDKKNLSALSHNTMVQYTKNNDKRIANKYFKQFDEIAGNIIVGFYKNNRRNYTESLQNIRYIFVKSITGGDNPLRGTMVVQSDQWKFIKRDSIISYRKKDTDEWVYKAKFNMFYTATNGTTLMSMTNERGYSYPCNPNKIAEIRRHVSDTDFKLAAILEKMHILEQRIIKLEKNKR